MRRALDKDKPVDVLTDQFERTKASIQAKVEHPFRVLKQQFGYVKVRYRGLKKNTAQIVTLFALGNLRMAKADGLHEAEVLAGVKPQCPGNGPREAPARGDAHAQLLKVIAVLGHAPP